MSLAMRHFGFRSAFAGAIVMSGAAVGLPVTTVQTASAQSLALREHTPSLVAGAATSGYRVRVGERARYDVELKGQDVGEGSLEVLGHAKVNGYPTIHASLRLTGGFLFAKVDDRFDSWFDPSRYFSRRFVQDQRELATTRKKNYEISPENGTFVEENSGDLDSLGTAEPLDDVSFLFYVRTLPLKVGHVDTIPRYFKSGRDVIIRVLRTERITVPAGTFETIVVQPTITNAGGLFRQGGKAKLYFSNDAARTLVKLESSVPVIGSLSLTLKDVRTAK